MKSILSSFAKFDLNDAKIYYKNIRPELAKEFLNEVNFARKFKEENPLTNDICYGNVRMHLLKKFPYHIHYFIDKNKNRNVILAVEFSKRGDLDYSHRI